jgi:osmotically-inducible protein OsmY
MNTRIDPRSPAPAETATLRSHPFVLPRRRWPGFLIVGILAAGGAALAVSSFYDRRSVGEKVDATVLATQQTVQTQVDDLRTSASAAARDGAQVTDRAAAAFNDAGITAAVKTSLAADPRLSAVKIAVKTEDGVVSLEGPAPDDRSRERAEILAAAPAGVLRVDNRLVVSPPAAALTR